MIDDEVLSARQDAILFNAQSALTVLFFEENSMEQGTRHVHEAAHGKMCKKLHMSWGTDMTLLYCCCVVTQCVLGGRVLNLRSCTHKSRS